MSTPKSEDFDEMDKKRRAEMNSPDPKVRSDLRDAEDQLKTASKALWEATAIISKGLYAVDEFQQAKAVATDLKTAREMIRAALAATSALATQSEKRLKGINVTLPGERQPQLPDDDRGGDIQGGPLNTGGCV